MTIWPIRSRNNSKFDNKFTKNAENLLTKHFFSLCTNRLCYLKRVMMVMMVIMVIMVLKTEANVSVVLCSSIYNF